MQDIEARLAALGIKIPEILFPKKEIDLYRWAVIACDQYTQDLNYWNEVHSISRGEPSCINLIFPEAELETISETEGRGKILSIWENMSFYLENDIFCDPRSAFIYIERSTARHACRRGIVLCIDLELYDWRPGTLPLIRATEGTVKDRLPPRVEIRRNAPLDIPHIVVLINDKDDFLIPALGDTAKRSPALYETPLMMNGGTVSAWALDTQAAYEILADGLERLKMDSDLLFAVGDGNHSLAAAKAVWDEFKNENRDKIDISNHPARWALVEIENIYDPGISFEPIHRLVFGMEMPELQNALSSINDIQCRAESSGKPVIFIESSSQEISTVSIEPVLDRLKKEKGISIDYIHGEDEIFRIIADSSEKAAGIILPPISKEGLFDTIALKGALPRKSFSMGEAESKRFYLECRKLFG